MSRRISWRILALGLAVVTLAAVVWRQWRGPVVPAYRVEARPLVQLVVATGRVVTPTRLQVGSQITAVVRERNVQEGDAVEAGELLAKLRADDLAARVREAEAALEQLQRGARPQAEATLREAEAQLEQAIRQTERRRELFERELVPREQLEQAEQAEIAARAAAETARVRVSRLAPGDADEAVLRERLAVARAELAKTEIRSPVAGTVLSRNAEPGDIVQPGTVLFEVAPRGGVELLVPLDEKNLAAVEVGQKARSVADAYPDAPFTARLTLIAPKIDPLRGTVDVRLVVDPVPGFLREDMTVSVNIETARRERALAIPNDAILTSADGAHVLALREGVAQRAPIGVGLRGLTRSEVVSGLEAGDLVLADPTLEPGQRVRTAIRTEPVAQSRANRALPLPPD